MTIRAPYQLTEELDQALAWRKKELSALFFLVRESREHERAALRRAAVPILYAHWEGFTKRAADSYLELVSRQRLRYRELKTNFVALASRESIKDAGISNRTYIQAQLVDFLLFNQDDRCNLPFRQVIKTHSNLNSEVLREIFFTLGVRYDAFWTSKEPLIDGSLLRIRNEIAHGTKTEVDQPTYEQLHHLVIEMISAIKDYTENAALQKSYLRENPSSASGA